MALHDYIISNATFPSTRTDLNNALSAIVSNNSYATTPTTTYAYMWWYDITSTTLKFRNADNDAWISFATFDMTGDTVNFLDSTVVYDIIGDTTPQLGGQLDINGNAIGDGSLELLKFIETASAVNELTITNNTTTNAPILSATGDDTNIDLAITPKGSGKIVLDGIKFPNADGTVDQILTTNGSGVLSFVDNSGGIAWDSTVVTGTTKTVVAGNGYWINTTSNACTVTLPASASVGDELIFTDYLRTWGTNAVTINQNSLKFQGYTSPNPVYDTSGQSVNLVYSGATQGWLPTVDDDVSNETPQPIVADFLVIAGGGGGGHDGSGGAGAGGYRASFNSEASGGGGSSESAITLTEGAAYTAVVGGGGAGDTNSGGTGVNGVNSSLSGADVTTITSIGGGGAGTGLSGVATGANGGSGGGAKGSGTGGSGTANQGYDGSGGNGSYVNGGGGGAGTAGGASIVQQGGIGVASTISGASVYRGGGGVGRESSGVVALAGGAGNGAYGSSAGIAATANTGAGGAGGGGTSGILDGLVGATGVVILRLPTSQYTGTTSGSPTISTSGSDTIITFNANGTYTA